MVEKKRNILLTDCFICTNRIGNYCKINKTNLEVKRIKEKTIAFRNTPCSCFEEKTALPLDLDLDNANLS